MTPGIGRWAAAGVALIVAVVPACGDDGTPATTTTTVPAPTTTTTTVPPTTTTTLRTVALGETFSLRLAESVSVRTENLSLTFTSVPEDSRCRPGQQCIVAGEASVIVAAAKDGMAPARLTIGAPGRARYGRYTVEVVQLGFGPSPSARLKVT